MALRAAWTRLSLLTRLTTARVRTFTRPSERLLRPAMLLEFLSLATLLGPSSRLYTSTLCSMSSRMDSPFSMSGRNPTPTWKRGEKKKRNF